MSKFSDIWKAYGEKLETPLTIRHVETHLFFGPLSRHLSLGFLVLAGGLIHLIWTLLSPPEVPRGQYIGDTIGILLSEILFIPFFLLQITRRQQAIIGWGVMNLTFGFAFFIMTAVGGFGGLAQGHHDALPLLFLGLLWIPSVEFIPKVTPHQKYVTVARLLLSIPCIYVGMKSGEWH